MSGPSVFISYAHEDFEWVNKFANELKKNNISVWLDQWQITAGESLRDAIEKGLRESDIIIVVLSSSNVDQPSVFFEMGVALGMRKRIIPIISKEVESTKVPFDLRLRRYLMQGAPDETAREIVEALKNQSSA